MWTLCRQFFSSKTFCRQQLHELEHNAKKLNITGETDLHIGEYTLLDKDSRVEDQRVFSSNYFRLKIFNQIWIIHSTYELTPLRDSQFHTRKTGSPARYIQYQIQKKYKFHNHSGQSAIHFHTPRPDHVPPKNSCFWNLPIRCISCNIQYCVKCKWTLRSLQLSQAWQRHQPIGYWTCELVVV